jgi:hypothetical protein
MNVWSCVTSSFKAATSSKTRDLRVRSDNPRVGVEPGDRESRQARRKTFLYPRESAALLACAAVPIAWREVYALALYTYPRPGELRVLTWSDVDEDAGVLHIAKAWEYADAKIKPPKTRNGVRRVPLEAELLPMLARMRRGREPGDVIVPALAAFGEDLGLLILGVAGCAASPVRTFQSPNNGGLKRASFELECPEDQLAITDLGGWTVGVTGCGKKAVYKAVAGAGWVNNTGRREQEPNAAAVQKTSRK